MKIKFDLTPKIIIGLLVAITALTTAGFALFSTADQIINVDLYRYGLTFSYKWADPYWLNAMIFRGSVGLTALLTGIAVVFYEFDMRKLSRITDPQFILLLLIGGIGLSSIAIYSLFNIDNIVNRDLYSFNLVYNNSWVNNYRFNDNILLMTAVVSIACLLASTVLIYFGYQKSKIASNKMMSYVLTEVGVIAFSIAIIYTNSIFAFIGLGLLFWAILFTFARTDLYIKKSVLDASAKPQLEINKILKELQFTGKTVYLPQKYYKNPETQKAFIPLRSEDGLPSPDQIQEQETNFFIKNPPGVLTTPTGSDLARLFEQNLNTNFSKVDLEYIQQNLPKIFTQELEIATSLEITIQNNIVQIRIENPVWDIPQNTSAENNESKIESPITSALACTLAKSTGKPIVVKNQQTNKNPKETIIDFEIIEDNTETENSNTQ